MKKQIAIILSAILALSMVACSNQKDEQGNADVVATASVYTNKYTNFDKETLIEEIGKYAGVTVVATTNPDNTPNIAILTPGVADENHIVFNLAPNTTKDNLRRTKVAEIVFDEVNIAAETKEGRHQGATVKIELEEDQAILDELKKSNEYVTDDSLVCKIVEVMPIG